MDSRSSFGLGTARYHLTAHEAPPICAAWTMPWPPSPSRSPTSTGVPAARTIQTVLPSRGRFASATRFTSLAGIADRADVWSGRGRGAGGRMWSGGGGWRTARGGCGARNGRGARGRAQLDGQERSHGGDHDQPARPVGQSLLSRDVRLAAGLRGRLGQPLGGGRRLVGGWLVGYVMTPARRRRGDQQRDR